MPLKITQETKQKIYARSYVEDYRAYTNNRFVGFEARQLFLEASEGKHKLFTSTIVFFEIYWVLSSYYEKKKEEITKALQKILALKFINLKERIILSSSLTRFKKTSFDLEDCYNLSYAKAKVVKSFKTFDAKLAKEFNRAAI